MCTLYSITRVQCTLCTLFYRSSFGNCMQSKSWIGTSYRLDEFRLPDVQYGVYQKEKCPTTGRVHIQFFVQYKKRIRLTGVKKHFPGDHLEIARDPKQARAYCQKEETRESSPVEVGTFDQPLDTEDMVSVVKRQRVSSILEEQPKLWRSLRQLTELRQLFSSPRQEMTRGYLFVGKTGSGKTRTASLISDFVGDTYWQDCSQWWNGYDGESLVVIDEFRGQWEPSTLLRILDRTPYKVPIKGGYSNFCSRAVIMTSNLDLVSMYKQLDPLTIDAFLRRLLIVRFV